MAGGRPTKYKKEFCERIPELMKDGASIEEVAAELGVAKGTLYNWSEKNVQFLNAIKRGEELSKAWWLKEGRTSLRDKDFSYTGWYMNMKNRHGWKDASKTEVDTGDALTSLIESIAGVTRGLPNRDQGKIRE